MPEAESQPPLATNEVRNKDIAGRLARGLWQGATRRRLELRYHLIREVWATTKRFATGDEVLNVEIADLPGMRDRIATAYIDDPNRAILSALCGALGARTFFEIGTNRGRTALSVARTNPEIEVYTLDLPGPEADTELDLTEGDKRLFEDWRRAEAFKGEPEESRITELLGDSAKFDYSPYEGKMDVVFIDGSHSYPYVTNDTHAAERMLTDNGMIVWDDYPGFPGVTQCVLEASRRLNGPVMHIRGTRMAIYSRTPFEVHNASEARAEGGLQVA